MDYEFIINDASEFIFSFFDPEDGKKIFKEIIESAIRDYNEHDYNIDTRELVRSGDYAGNGFYEPDEYSYEYATEVEVDTIAIILNGKLLDESILDYKTFEEYAIAEVGEDKIDEFKISLIKGKVELLVTYDVTDTERH